MTRSPGRIVTGIGLFIASVWTVYHFGLAPRASTSTRAVTSGVQPALVPEPVANQAEDGKAAIESLRRLRDDLSEACRTGTAAEFGPLLDRVVAAVPSEPSHQFDQVIEQLIRFAQRGRRLSNDEHEVFPATLARRLLPMYTPKDHLLTRGLTGQLPLHPLNDGKDWEATRQADLDLNLRVWLREKRKIDFNYDPAAPDNYPLDFGTLPVPDPLGRYQPGTLPEKIKEPEIRTAYEQSRTRNLAKGVKRLQQYQARELERMLHEHVEYYLPRAFAYPPDKIDTVPETLAKYDFHTKNLDAIQAAARRDLAIVKKARERDAANKKLLDELRATGRLKD